MRVVIDTNVIVSAIISRPTTPPARLLAHWQAQELDLLISEPILNEYQRALTYPHIQARHKKTNAEVEVFLKRFGQLALKIDTTETIKVVQQDPHDNMFIECALAGNAEYIVSGDQDLLTLEVYRDIRIVTPRTFLALLEQEQAA